MKRNILLILEVILCLILQTVFFPNFSIADIIPNVMIILTVSVAYMHGKLTGLFIGLISGLLMDLCYGQVVGLYALLYMVIGYINGIAQKIYYKDDFTIPIILVGVSDFAYGFLFYVFEFLLRGRLNLFFYVRRIIFPEVVYTVFVSIILYKLFNVANNGLEQLEQKEG